MNRQDSDLTGQCLIAMPQMSDPRFQRTVIYLCSHGLRGAMGLVVNRPRTGRRFAHLLEGLGLTPSPGLRDIRVHVGGPVEPQRGFVLHSPDYLDGGDSRIIGTDAALTTTPDILSVLAQGLGPRSAVFALGYAGWGPGQLDGELAHNDWLTAPARADLLFGRADEFKWASALKSIGVDPTALSGAGGRA